MRVTITHKNHILNFTAKYSQGGILKAPKNGLMKRNIEESITAEIELSLTDKKGINTFEGRSNWVGMELSEAFDLEV